MPGISIRGNTLYREHAEAVGIVDGQGALWFKDIPNGETLWSEDRYTRLRDKKLVNHARGWQPARKFEAMGRGLDCQGMGRTGLPQRAPSFRELYA